jgi:putative ABC transport system substrate-binding protein
LLAGLFLAPARAWAQPAAKVPRIGVLVPGAPPTRPTLDALKAGLRDIGYVEGRTLVLDVRWAGNRTDRWPELATELVRRPVDLIVAGTHEAALGAKAATTRIPIVVTTAREPFEGLFASLARPGGNVTGLVLFSTGVSGKRVEVLKDAVPGLARVGVLFRPRAQMPGMIQETEAAAQSLRLEVLRLEVRRGDGQDLEAAFQQVTRERAGAVVPGCARRGRRRSAGCGRRRSPAGRSAAAGGGAHRAVLRAPRRGRPGVTVASRVAKAERRRRSNAARWKRELAGKLIRDHLAPARRLRDSIRGR